MIRDRSAPTATADERAARPPWAGGRISPWRLAVRAFVSLLVATISVRVADLLLDGFDAGSRPVVVALATSLLGAIVGPVAVRFLLPVFVYTAGLASLLLNALIVSFVADVVPSAEVDSLGTALLVSFVTTTVAMVASWLLSLDDDATFARAVVRRAARRRGDEAAAHADTPGIIFLEIDGCSYGVLQRAIRAGYMPNLGRWLRSGSHRLHRWETDLSSQTGASQAGLLLGTNEGIVAFRWFERDRQEIVVSGKPHDAALIERRLSSGSGLLADGGASRNNLLTGDAPSAMMTLSTVLARGRASRTWTTYFQSADNVARTVIRIVADVVEEVVWTVRLRRRHVWPRLEKGWRYPFLRAGTTVVMPDVTVDTLVGDMLRGVPAAYATFVGYDEVAHHDGVERPAALEQLRRLDRHFGRLEQARSYSHRPYGFVVLSDHGQSQGATFLQRYGESLEQLVARTVGSRHRTRARTTDEDSVAQLSGALNEAASGGGFVSRVGQRALAEGGAPVGGSDDEVIGPDDVLVMASGNLGLIYVVGRTERMTLAELDGSCPRLVETLATHPGIGFVVVATDDGNLAIGADGRRHVETGKVDGVDPLAGYGPNVLRHLRRHVRFEHMPDALLVGTWWSDVGEVAAFEELIGSHGGLGGEQSEAFVLAPSSFPWPSGEVIGAGSVHRVLRSWLRPRETGRAVR